MRHPTNEQDLFKAFVKDEKFEVLTAAEELCLLGCYTLRTASSQGRSGGIRIFRYVCNNSKVRAAQHSRSNKSATGNNTHVVLMPITHMRIKKNF